MSILLPSENVSHTIEMCANEIFPNDFQIDKYQINNLMVKE